MKNFRFSMALCLLPAFAVLIFGATSWAQQRPAILDQLAKTYGLESFGQIEAIRYTFNAEAPGLDLSRSWTWEPKTDQVTYEGQTSRARRLRLPTCAFSSAASRPK